MFFKDLLNLELFTLGGTPVTLGTVLTGVLILIVSFAVSRILQQGITRTFRRRGMGNLPTAHITGRLLHYAIMLIGMGVALDTVGLDLGALFAAGAVFAIGLGFAMQNIAQNFVSGVILLIERSIKPGDILDVDGTVVRVIQMGIRTTLARTRDDEEIIVPNAVLVQSVVKNFTLRDSLFRVRVSVGVTYGSDMRLVLDTLRRVADEVEWKSAQKPPRVLMTEFGNSSVNFDVSVWVDDPWEAPTARSQLHETIWWALKEVGVIIAFPQLDIHLDEPVSRTLELLATR